MTGQRLLGRVAMVTGGSSGIGRACAVRLASEGCQVVAVSSRNVDGLRETAELIASAGGECLVQLCDVSSEDSVGLAMGVAAERFGRLDILVNNAGRPQEAAPADALDAAEWDLTLDVDLRGAFLVTRAAIPLLRKSTAGASVVNVSSTNSFLHVPGNPAYAAAKGGLDALTRQMAIEYARDGIRFNGVNPGLIVVESVQEFLDASPEDRIAYETAYPLPRLGLPEDVAGVVCFLASDDAAYVTGSSIPVDGGLSVLSPSAVLNRHLRLPPRAERTRFGPRRP